jgi:hypothetical protein
MWSPSSAVRSLHRPPYRRPTQNGHPQPTGPIGPDLRDSTMSGLPKKAQDARDRLCMEMVRQSEACVFRVLCPLLTCTDCRICGGPITSIRLSKPRSVRFQPEHGTGRPADAVIAVCCRPLPARCGHSVRPARTRRPAWTVQGPARADARAQVVRKAKIRAVARCRSRRSGADQLRVRRLDDVVDQRQPLVERYERALHRIDREPLQFRPAVPERLHQQGHLA